MSILLLMSYEEKIANVNIVHIKLRYALTPMKGKGSCYLQLNIWNTPIYLYMYNQTKRQIIRTSQIIPFPEGIHFLKFYS